VLACTRCALCHTRTQAVFGVGDPATRLLFVGEAPGFDEDRQGEPFVGRAGQLLNDIIKAMGLKRSEVYIANVIKCRPPQNRVPNPAEVGSCFGYLETQIEIIAPEVIIALGAVAAKALLGTTESMGRIRSRFHDYRGIPVMPTYHPAYLLRNPAEKRKVWEDVQLVMARLGLRRG
jgi:DNA polymerase